MRSSGNLTAMGDARNSSNPCYVDPVYAMPVKPFLSSQDIRNTAAAAPRNYGGNVVGNAVGPGLTVLTPSTSSQPSIVAAGLQKHIPKVNFCTQTKNLFRNAGIVLVCDYEFLGFAYKLLDNACVSASSLRFQNVELLSVLSRRRYNLKCRRRFKISLYMLFETREFCSFC